MNEAKKSIKKLFESGRMRNVVLIAGGLGIALIFLSSFISPGKPAEDSGSIRSVEEYGERTENELASLISKIQGAGKTRVLLTMENSIESVYLDNSTTKTKEIEPRIRGVLVLCEGGDDPVAVSRITEAVTKALDISSAKVCIAKLSE